MKPAAHRLVLVGLLLVPLAHAQDAGTAEPPGLVGVRWRWLHFTKPRAAPLVPPHPDNYWVEFRPDGTLVLQADCNRGTGAWTHKGSEVKVKPLATTLMACPEGSLDSRFTQLLAQVVRASVRGRELLLWLPEEAGVLHFEPTSPETPAHP